jgi:aryl-alcohol dehydrogenase-like predicted oxidoreductase
LEDGEFSSLLKPISFAHESYSLDRFKRTGNRDKIFLATKFGITANGIRGDPEFVKAECDKSLQRLGVDCIDLYYQHR